MPPIHGSVSDKRFVSLHTQCNLHNVTPSEVVSGVVEQALDDQVFFMNVVNRIKDNKKQMENLPSR